MKNIKITYHNVTDFIVREIEGSASEIELLALKEWVKESDENEKFYNELKKVDELYSADKIGKINTDKAWKKVKRRMDDLPITGQVRPINRWRIMGYAAAMIVTLIGAFTLFQPKDELPNIMTANLERVHEMNDGSRITLQANSALSQLSKDERIFNFSGKAEFEVTHNDELPFQVNINEVRIMDLGTVFEIDAQPDNDTLLVNVSEGLVKFFTLSHSGIFLNEGEEGMYIKSKNKFYKRSIDVRNQSLDVTFNNSTLDEVMEHLSYSFRKKVSLENEALKDCPINVSFSYTTYEEVKDIIEETLNLKFTEEGDRLLISGTRCQ